ncbi:MAG: tRNA (guanosine(46)-N7)-methyltransferase TrmB [Alphaproteobacteria bacterium]
MDPRPNRLYGRRKGHALRTHQAQLMIDMLPGLAVDVSTPIDPAALFPQAECHYMEIGFGGGEHLAHEATQNPQAGFIGCEPFENGMAKMLAQIEAGEVSNVRLHMGDAIEVLRALPDSGLDRVDLLYPDPWPKKRHWKRRFVSMDSLGELARAIKPGGLFRFASDIDTYVDWTLSHCRAHHAFEWTAEKAADWLEPWDGWPGTRYEAKAIREGRPPHYLIFKRV